MLRTRFLTGRLVAMVILLLIGIAILLPAASTLALGSIVYDGSPGTDAPPATLGPYTMTPFAPDTRDLFIDVTTIPSPLGDVQLSPAANHRRIGGGWVTWSHGYLEPLEPFTWSHGYIGDVYFVNGTQVTLTLPPNTFAFYLYVEPNRFNKYSVTVTADGTSSGPVGVVGGSGATYFGFYSTTGPISTIVVSVEKSARGFAIGEFGIATGAPILPTSPRADVAVIIYGGWSGIPVSAWVGGTLQPVLTTAPNHEGYPAVLFTFWPPAGTMWQVSVSPSLPAGLDPERWEYELLWVETPSGFSKPTGGSIAIMQGSHYVLHYQLIDKGALQ